ncbi:MAG TPA: DUF1553 domain-containing protein [Puia sp.]|nr:DUF1553 domain-containing protein [Puia sp.]
MKKFSLKKGLIVLLVLAAGIAVYFIVRPSNRVDFNADVKPILNKKCISCHGGVRQKANYSLLFRSDALLPAKSGKYPIVPGNPDHSEIIRRIISTDPEERMPYRSEPLTSQEIDILRRWIKEGAPWGDHWAYVPVKQQNIPSANDKGWVRNDIDRFILDKLGQIKLQHSPEADSRVLLRRVSLDAIGLPAPKNLAEAYLKNPTDRAYETLVDSLLANKHFGERWASMWLDLARYADSKGYEKDEHRDIWRYRDWLIRAFNGDKPYDQFLTEQLAGDLMPNPTEQQLIATAFHRNTMTNDEGGTDNEEFRTAAVIDRVNTTWQALMGTTFGCVQCHSHPYDPFRHDEYYKFMAFFNNTRDEDTFGDYPELRSYGDSAKEKMKELVEWVSRQAGEQRAKEIKTFLLTWEPSINSQNADQLVNSAIEDTKWLVLRNHAVARLTKVDLDKKDQLIFRYNSYVPHADCEIHLDKPDGPLAFRFDPPKKGGGWTIGSVDFPALSGVHDIWFVYSSPLLKKPEDSGLMFDWLYFTQQFPGKGAPGYESMQHLFWQLDTMQTSTTPVMMENPEDMHRNTYVFERGNWLVKGAQVQPDVPHSLNPFPRNMPKNRLGLAAWIVSKDNPLTARTIVNRFWEQIFGTGLAETLEDLGTQGIPPTHPELLDYLSWKLMNDDGWSLKKLLKEILMSATYRQDSRVTKEGEEKDPFNKYYGRGPRVRLTGEQIRDETLAVTGLLSEKMYGPSVFPYQPKGIWLTPWGTSVWKKSEGEDQYRRAVYTYWKRSSPYPSMMSFDGADREVCTARRIRTNTPLQALVTLNDSAFLEAAKHFAVELQTQNPGHADLQIKQAFARAIGHDIDEQSFEILQSLYKKALVKFKQHPEKSKEMNGTNTVEPELSALVVVTNAILNLDEYVTKS